MSAVSHLSTRIAEKWLVLIAVTLGMLMSLMDMTMVNVAIPSMQAAFGADVQSVQWVVTIYMLAQAVFIPAAPFLARRFGGKRAYVGTLIAFLLGTLLCGFAWSLTSLLLFRLIQGIGGGILLPLVSTLLYGAFSTEERGGAVSKMGVATMAALVVGPVLGGYLVTTFGWQWAFWANVPVGIAAVLFAQRGLRQAHAVPQTRFDLAGFVAIAAGSTALLIAVSSTARADAWRNLLMLGAGLAFLALFAGIELGKLRRGQLPLLDLRRFRDRTFTFSNVANVCVAIARFGIVFLLPIYLQTLHGLSAAQAGLILATQAVATMIVLPFGGRLSDRLGPRPVAIAGLSLMVVAVLLMLRLALETPVGVIVALLALLGCAFAFLSQITVAAMSRIEKHEAQEVANGSTLISVLHATAAPLGVALLSSVVQTRSQAHAAELAAAGMDAALAELQGSLQAMHDSFLIAAGLVLLALAAMCFVPKRRPQVTLGTEASGAPDAELTVVESRAV